MVPRLLQAAGLLTAIIGLAGFWFWPDPGRTELSTVQQELLGLTAEDSHVSFLVAGRDIMYAYSRSDPVYSQAGNIICWRPNGTRSVQGVNTDTIIYASLRNNELNLITIPRDLFMEPGSSRKVNQLIGSGPEALVAGVEQILGLPVDHYAIINLEIFQNLVDALGGVQVEVPRRMYYSDCTGGLDIDLQPGLQVLDGEQASGFIRFRQLPRGDLDRLEHLKLLAYGMLNRVRELSLGAVTRLPAIVNTYYSDVQTDFSTNDILALLPRIPSVTIGAIGTLPTELTVQNDTEGVVMRPEEVELFLAGIFGGRARTFAEAPEQDLLITDRSGLDDAAAWHVEQLQRLGLDPELITVRELEADGNPTRFISTLDGWEAAGYWSEAINTGVQQVDRIGNIEGSTRQLELVLGPDALDRVPGASRLQPPPEPLPGLEAAGGTGGGLD